MFFFSRRSPVRAGCRRCAAGRQNPKLCNHCGDCGEICQFYAIVCLGNKVLTFPQLCHSCGGCELWSMPRWTLSARLAGKSASSRWVEAARSVSPRALLRHRRGHEPAGDSSGQGGGARSGDDDRRRPPRNVVPGHRERQGLRLVILVTEPTTSGSNDLELAVEMSDEVGIPCEVVVNRAFRKTARDQGILSQERGRDRRPAPRGPASRGIIFARCDCFEDLPEFHERYRSLLAHQDLE